MVIGIAATNTTTLELQISGNDKMTNQTFYRADAATREAMGHMLIEDLDDAPGWMLDVGNLVLPTGMDPDDERDAVYDDTVWTANSSPSQPLPDTQMMVVHRGIAPGSSLDLGASRIHAFEVYGRSQQNNSLAIIKTGFRNNYR